MKKCFSCGSELNLKKFKNIYIKTPGNPVPFEIAYICINCKSKLIRR